MVACGGGMITHNSERSMAIFGIFAKDASEVCSATLRYHMINNRKIVSRQEMKTNVITFDSMVCLLLLAGRRRKLH